MVTAAIQSPQQTQTPAQATQASLPKTREKWVALATITVPLVVISAFAIIAMTYTGGGWFGAVSAWFTSGPSLNAPLFGSHLVPDFFIYCWIGLALAVAIAAPLLAIRKEKAAQQPLWFTPEPGYEAINLDWIQKVQKIRGDLARKRDLLPTT